MRQTQRIVSGAGLLAATLLSAACGGGDSGSSTTSVTPPATVDPVATVVIAPPSASVVIGATTQLAAATLNASGSALSGRTVNWSVASAAIATVSSSGLITGVAAGTTTVSATSEGKVGTAAITVTAPTPQAYAPTVNGTLAGTQRYASISIPAGVTITITGNLDMSASGPVAIAGSITGNCTPISISSDNVTTITGTVDNSCATLTTAGPDIMLVGKGGIALTGATVKSSANITVTNDPTLTLADFPGAPKTTSTRALTSNGALLQANPDCAVSGSLTSGAALPAPAASDTMPAGGAPGARVRVFCRGNATVSGPPSGGGTTITAQNGQPGSAGVATSATAAVARGGDGGIGGDVSIGAIGDITFSGSVSLISGTGGAGGSATATGLQNTVLPRGGDASALAGKGAAPGFIFVNSRTTIAISGALIYIIGNAGPGGIATAVAANGNAANGNIAAQGGGNAIAAGGEGGSTFAGTAVALGSVTGSTPTVRGGNGGTGGAATATAGNGGDGSATNKNGAAGGMAIANLNITSASQTTSAGTGGNGGNANLRDFNGLLIGVGGSGSAVALNAGKGGGGYNGCNGSPTSAGGTGGAGGAASGHDGAGGTGLTSGTAGGITFNTLGVGGNGGNGVGPGAGGAGGTDATTAVGQKKNLPTSFIAGTPGQTCQVGAAYNLKPVITVAADPNGHEQFVAYTSVQSLSVSMNGSTIIINGSGVWVPVMGTVDAMGHFVATGSGTVAFNANVPAMVTGTVAADKTISGTIQLGQSTPPTGLPNGPVTYTLKTSLP